MSERENGSSTFPPGTRVATSGGSRSPSNLMPGRDILRLARKLEKRGYYLAADVLRTHRVEVLFKASKRRLRIRWGVVAAYLACAPVTWLFLKFSDAEWWAGYGMAVLLIVKVWSVATMERR